MNNLYGQMQQDIASTANNLMTQMLCAEKGIDHNQLMQSAQQIHLQSILQAEQNRQIAQVVKRHYQGNSGSFISKIRDAFAPDPVSPFMPMPMSMGMPVQQPMMNQQPAQPVQSPEQVSQLFNPQPVEVPLEDDTTSKRLDNLESKMNNMEAMLAQIAQAVQK